MQPEVSPSQPVPNQHINGTTKLSCILFGWSYYFIKNSQDQSINTQFIPKLPQEYSSSTKCNHFYNIWEQNKLQTSENLLLYTIIQTFKEEITTIIILAVLNYSLYLAYPVLINYDISYIQDGGSNLHLGIILFFITIIGQFLESVLSVHLKYRQTVLGVNISNTINLAIFKKTTKYPIVSCRKFTDTDIINYSQIDADNLKHMGNKFIFFTFGIIQVIVGLVLLVIVIDLLFFIALALMVVVNIVCFKIGKVMIQNNLEALQSKDLILSGTKEMLMNIKHIKSHGLEKSYYAKITGVRQKQLGALKLKGILQSLMTFLYFLTSPCLLSAIFLAQILISKQITPAKIYVTLTIGRIFQFTAVLLPNSIGQFAAIYNSIKRIETFLLAEQIGHDRYQIMPYLSEDQCSVVVSRGIFYPHSAIKQSFQITEEGFINNVRSTLENRLTSRNFLQISPDLSPQKPLLNNINMTIEKGNFHLIIGGVGSGKSSLLLSILNELKGSNESRISINGSIAYASQKPWMMCDTLENNVYFTSEHNESRLIEVLGAVCLLDDVSLLPQGGNTSVGEDGINLSAGQKASLSLARAIYSQSDIYLLDDVMSQIHPQIGQNILKDLVTKTLKGKTVILATSSTLFAHLADKISIMKKGEIVAQGAYQTISLLTQFSELKQSNELSLIDEDEEQKQIYSQQPDYGDIQKLASNEEIFRNNSTNAANRLVLDEQVQSSPLKYEVIIQYIKLNGGYFSFFSGVIGSLISYSAFQTVGSIFMDKWSDSIGTKSSFLFYYIGFIIGSNIFIFIQSYLLLVSSVSQGKQVHYSIIKKLLFSSYTRFFSRVPAGRILNRLSKDLKELDEVVGINLSICLIYLVQLISGIILVVFSTTYFAIIPVVIVFVACILIRRYYVLALHRIARLEKVSNSPLISGLMTLISGLTTIRAYREENYYIQGQAKMLDDNKKMTLNKYGLESWFELTQIYLIFILNSFCVGYAMFSSRETSSDFGLLLISIISINEIINGLIFQFTTFQTNLICLQRLYHFMKLPVDPIFTQQFNNLDVIEELIVDRANDLSIQFNMVSIRYREDLPDIVSDLSLSIKQGQKLAIVGHTNSGKSTILSALIRIAEVSKGTISIGKDYIKDISISQLRNMIAIVQQQPTFVLGTFRQNLDFMNNSSNQQMRSILYDCNILQLVDQRGGLLGKIDKNGLSMSEKQILCICRALLSNCKILLIDDATSSLDAKQDSIIQDTILSRSKDKTVINVTNKPSTFCKYDKVAVLSQGRMIEYGSPQELYSFKGVLYKTIKQSMLQNAFRSKD